MWEKSATGFPDRHFSRVGSLSDVEPTPSAPMDFESRNLFDPFKPAPHADPAIDGIGDGDLCYAIRLFQPPASPKLPAKRKDRHLSDTIGLHVSQGANDRIRRCLAT